MTTLHCDHCMNLPCDAVTVLIMITCVLIYVLAIAFVLINYYNPVHVQYLLHNICLHLLRCTVYTCSGVACVVNLLYIVHKGVTLMLLKLYKLYTGLSRH